MDCLVSEVNDDNALPEAWSALNESLRLTALLKWTYL